ncbi:hypothetical protein Tco_1552434, partial [Tanacetum coccineum]
VIREPESVKFQPLPEVKGKEKVSEEQVAQVLINLQTPKKKSLADQYIFQRRSSAPTEPSGHDESSSLYAELVSQPQPSHVVHAGPNLKHMDVEVTDTSIQQNPEQMDEEVTTTAYPNVQENLKLPTEDQVRLEEPANSVGTLSSLQNLDKEFSFTHQFLEEKSQEDEPEKTNTESEVQSMVTVPIHQDTSLVPPMATPVIDLTVSHPVSTTVHAPLPTSTTTTTTIITTSLPPPPPQPQQSSSDPILLQCIRDLEKHIADLIQSNLALEERLDKHVEWAMQAPLRARFSDLPTVDMKEVLQQRMFEDKSYLAHEDHKNLFEALEKSLESDHSNQLLSDLEEARRKKRKKRASPRTLSGSPPSKLPPPPPSASASRAPSTSRASGSSQLPQPPPPPSTGTLGSAQQQGSKAPSSS